VCSMNGCVRVIAVLLCARVLSSRGGDHRTTAPSETRRAVFRAQTSRLSWTYAAIFRDSPIFRLATLLARTGLGSSPRIQSTPGTVSFSGIATYYDGFTNVTALAVHPSGQFLFALTAPGVFYQYSWTISVYAIDTAMGALTPVAAVPVQGGFNPNALLLDSEGRFLCVTSGIDSSILAFSIDIGSGTLASLSPLPLSQFAVTKPSRIAIEPRGRFLYVEATDTFVPDTEIVEFATDPSAGALTVLPRSQLIVPSGYGTYGLLIDPSAKFAYAVTSSSSLIAGIDEIVTSLSTFTIDPSKGSLTATAQPATTLGSHQFAYETPIVNPIAFVQ
jgi:hypothetical protein